MSQSIIQTPVVSLIKNNFKSSSPAKDQLINKLLDNIITPGELKDLREDITADDLSNIIQRIYDLNEKFILKISSLEGLLRKLDDMKNQRRNKLFEKKIKAGFRNFDASKKIILVEGDSWFNYPVILTDVIDRVSMEKNFAVYSIASGGDWLLNMLTARIYVEELSVLHPDYFLISAGGNDLVGSSRLAAVLQSKPDDNEYYKNEWIKILMSKKNTVYTDFNKADFDEGIKYLSKDFFALIMFFHLQYYFMMSRILNGGNEENNNAEKKSKFPGIKIITQGYDFVIPSYNKRFGLNPFKWYIPFIRTFLGHGQWLKTPMQKRGINDKEVQRKIMYAIIYLFNEVMIDIGSIFNKSETDEKHVFHIDSRGSVGDDGWTDELHPQPKHFMKTGEVFVGCINDAEPTYKHVFVVKKKKAI